MRHFKYIFVFVLLGFFGKALALSETSSPGISSSKEKGWNTFKKYSQAPELIKQADSKLSRQKRPKKPKAIKVIDPDICSLVFRKFYHFSDVTVHEVKGNYLLHLHYSHGKRGPPSDLI